mgnify:CR=1 FL=1
MRSEEKPRISTVSILLVLAASIGLVSAAMTNRQLPGFENFYGGIYARSQSPTVTYQGYLSMSFDGAYHYVAAEPLCRKTFPPCLAPDEVVFYLETERGTVRLIFYCGLDYCSRATQLPFSDGAHIYVKGTFLEPSKWPAGQYEPNLQFIGDLYVFQNSTVSGKV